MKQWVKIRRLGAINTGKILAVWMAFIGVVYAVIFLLVFSIGFLTKASPASGVFAGGLGLLMFALFPVLFAIMGFVYGITGAAIFNFLVARMDGWDMLMEFPGPKKR
ncbi:hypothetical protein KJ765_02265 [Candidatus Micrarchaeota archaeon]|nr:hypothetical protein [Candidatus Micrarchaeota archaeon]